MVARKYVPDTLDIVWLDFEPAKGREMAKVRPAFVLSPKKYNERAELILVCPITSASKEYPFEVSINTSKISGVILADQIRSVSWPARNVRFIDKASVKVLEEIKVKLNPLLAIH